MRAVVYKDPKGYSVWLVAAETGDKRELIEGELRKAQAQKLRRETNARLEKFRKSVGP